MFDDDVCPSFDDCAAQVSLNLYQIKDHFKIFGRFLSDKVPLRDFNDVFLKYRPSVMELTIR